MIGFARDVMRFARNTTLVDPLADRNVTATLMVATFFALTGNVYGACNVIAAVTVWDFIRETGAAPIPRLSLYYVWVAALYPQLLHVIVLVHMILDDNIKVKSESAISSHGAIMVGSEFSIRFKSAVDPNMPTVTEYEAMDHVIQHVAALRKVREYKLAGTCSAIIATAMLSSGFKAEGLAIGVLIALIFYTVLSFKTTRDENIPPQRYPGDPIRGPPGVYAVEQTNFISKTAVGVGYLAEGTFTTRWHVTLGRPIRIGDRMVTPSYINSVADVVCYGGAPKISKVEMGDEIIVMLAGPFSDIVIPYRSIAMVNKRGEVTFTGKLSMEGTSGSPIFRKRDNNWEYAGCTGWRCEIEGDYENQVVQTFNAISDASPTSADIVDRQTIQHFSSPGSGKTWSVIPDLVLRGLAKYGRVYVTAPTRVVAEEQYKSLNSQEALAGKVNLNIKGAKNQDRKAHAPIIVMAHQTALTMVLSGDTKVSKPGLWIMDEAHFTNTGSQCLKHLLRAKVANNGGSLYELTATGYNIETKEYVYCDGSNYPIKDTYCDKSSMLEMLATEDRKAVVFVTAIKGQDPCSSESIRKLLPTGAPVVDLSRDTFTHNYHPAVSMEKGFILTTDISECGANLNADVVYDFQESTKPTCYQIGDCHYTRRPTTRGQAIQRRGRIGRKKAGEYVAPLNYKFLEMEDPTRAENYDVAIFCDALDIEPKDPEHRKPVSDRWRLTKEQVIKWLGEGEHGMSESPYLIKKYTNGSGGAKTTDQMRAVALEWAKGGPAEMLCKREDGDKMISVGCWDARDASGCYMLGILAGAITNKEIPKSITPKQVSTLNRTFHRVSRAIASFGKDKQTTSPVIEEATTSATSNTSDSSEAEERQA